jgi:hypothetical protein
MNVLDRSAVLRGVLAGAFLYAFASSASAQDATTKQDPAAKQDATTKPDAATPTDEEAERRARAEAVAALPTWESYGAGGEAGMEETFFRLARDFVMTSDEGIHPLGHVPVWPRGEFKIAGIRVLPFVREGVVWDYNYYRQPETGDFAGDNGRKPQWTHQNEIGAMGDLSLMGGRLGIASTVDSIWNVRYGHDAPKDTWDFEGQIGATYRWPSGVWIAGGYRYNRTHDPDDLPVSPKTDFGRTTNGAFFNLGFDRDIFFGTKLQFEFGVQTNNERADDQIYSDLNRTETTVFGKASYPFLGRNTCRAFLLLSETLNQRDSEAINNGNTLNVSFGVEGSIPLREGEYRGLRGQVSLGFQSGHYEDNTYTQGSQTFVQDKNSYDTTLMAIVALQYVMSPRTTLDLRYTHDVEFSFYGNYQEVDRIEFSATHTFTRQLVGRADVYYEHENPSGYSPQQPLNGIDLSKPAPNVNREGGGVGLRYAVNEWCDLDLSVNAENRNDHENSFRNYEGVFGVTFYLNAIKRNPRVGPDR